MTRHVKAKSIAMTDDQRLTWVKKIAKIAPSYAVEIIDDRFAVKPYYRVNLDNDSCASFNQETGELYSYRTRRYIYMNWLGKGRQPNEITLYNVDQALKRMYKYYCDKQQKE